MIETYGTDREVIEEGMKKLKAGEFAEAILFFTEVIKNSKDPKAIAAAYYRRGNAKRNLNQLAIDDFKKAHDLNQDNYGYQRIIGIYLVELLRDEEAIVELDKTLSQKPDDVYVLCALMEAHAHMGNIEKAIELYNKIDEIDHDKAVEFHHIYVKAVALSPNMS